MKKVLFVTNMMEAYLLWVLLLVVYLGRLLLENTEILTFEMDSYASPLTPIIIFLLYPEIFIPFVYIVLMVLFLVISINFSVKEWNRDTEVVSFAKSYFQAKVLQIPAYIMTFGLAWISSREYYDSFMEIHFVWTLVFVPIAAINGLLVFRLMRSAGMIGIILTVILFVGLCIPGVDIVIAFIAYNHAKIASRLMQKPMIHLADVD